MKYKDFSTENFINDSFFRQWVLRPGKKSDRFWREWIRKNPDKEKEVNEARAILLGQNDGKMPEPFPRLKKEVLWNRIQDTIEDLEKDEQPDIPKEEEAKKVIPLHGRYAGVTHTGQRRKKSRYPAAAVVSIVLVALLIAFYFHKAVPPVIEQDPSLITKANPRGQKSRVYLPDGTKVTLNSNSEISYLEDFSGSIREVNLKGEAFFEVTRDVNKPFIVRSDDIATKVLGTSFNIQCDRNMEIKVSLVTGKVEVLSGDDDGTIEHLTPGEQLSFHRETGAVSKQRFDPVEVLAWKEGIIIFKDATRKEVFDRLSAWYGVDFVFENDPPNSQGWEYSARYQQISLEQVLKGMSYSKNFSYSIEGSRVFISYHEP